MCDAGALGWGYAALPFPPAPCSPRVGAACQGPAGRRESLPPVGDSQDPGVSLHPGVRPGTSSSEGATRPRIRCAVCRPQVRVILFFF